MKKIDRVSTLIGKTVSTEQSGSILEGTSSILWGGDQGRLPGRNKLEEKEIVREKRWQREH